MKIFSIFNRWFDYEILDLTSSDMEDWRPHVNWLKYENSQKWPIGQQAILVTDFEPKHFTCCKFSTWSIK